MASASPDPWRAMCATASSKEATTRMDRVSARYSVSQSASVAGRTAGASARVEGHPRTSMALHTPGRSTLALKAISAAIPRSADSST